MLETFRRQGLQIERYKPFGKVGTVIAGAKASTPHLETSDV